MTGLPFTDSRYIKMTLAVLLVILVCLPDLLGATSPNPCLNIAPACTGQLCVVIGAGNSVLNTDYKCINTCTTSGCQNGGTCSSGVCTCQGPYSGNFCEVRSLCAVPSAYTCANGGTCGPIGLLGGAWSYGCTCVGSFFGYGCYYAEATQGAVYDTWGLRTTSTFTLTITNPCASAAQTTNKITCSGTTTTSTVTSIAWGGFVMFANANPMSAWPLTALCSAGTFTSLGLTGSNIAGNIGFLAQLSSCTALTALTMGTTTMTGDLVIPSALAALATLTLSQSMGLTSVTLPDSTSYRTINVNGSPLMTVNWNVSATPGLLSVDLGQTAAVSATLSSTAILGNGVTFSSLTVINLYSTQLMGTIPSDVNATLPAIKVFVASYAGLTGTLPTGFFANTLTYLDLSGNFITGSIPASMGANNHALITASFGGNPGLNGAHPDTHLMSALLNFNLSSTQITGPGGNPLAGAMQMYNGSFTKMSGTIPATFLNRATMISFDISGCAFSGAIPTNLNLMVALTFLSIKNNLLTSLTTSLSALTALQTLDLSLNSLTTLPTQIGQLTGLASLNVSGNPITALPTQISACTLLTSVDISYMSLSGTLISQVMQLPLLAYIDYSHNTLNTVGFPTVLTKMVHWNMGFNSFSGTFPTSIGSYPNLQFLALASATFTGALPTQLGLLTKLVTLDLSGNTFTTVPTQIANLILLVKFDLNHNRLTLFITQFGSLVALQYLDISFNAMSSITIPTQIGTMSSLQTLIFDWIGTFGTGGLTTGLPTEIGNCANLKFIRGQNVDLRGSVPTQLWGIAGIQHVDLSSNGGTLGTLPTTVGLLTQLNHLDLSITAFSGSIPTELGKCTALTYLGFGGYSLHPMTGSIPTELGNLINLQYFTGINAPFSGTLPTQLFNISSLTYLNLATNTLRGTLPQTWASSSIIQLVALNGNTLSGTIPPFLATGSNVPAMTTCNLYSPSSSYVCPPTVYSEITTNDYASIVTACSNCTGHCSNGGVCSVGENCACTSGFSGSTCTLSGCTSTPCLHAGTCVPTVYPAYSCSCVGIWGSTNCSSQGCDSSPCQHGGTCTSGSPFPNFSCSNCNYGWTGNNCGTRVNPNPCIQNSISCAANKQCFINGTTYLANSTVCQSDCNHGGVCLNDGTCNVGTGVCTCVGAYVGNFCEARDVSIGSYSCYYGVMDYLYTLYNAYTYGCDNCQGGRQGTACGMVVGSSTSLWDFFNLRSSTDFTLSSGGLSITGFPCQTQSANHIQCTDTTAFGEITSILWQNHVSFVTGNNMPTWLLTYLNFPYLTTIDLTGSSGYGDIGFLSLGDPTSMPIITTLMLQGSGAVPGYTGNVAIIYRSALTAVVLSKNNLGTVSLASSTGYTYVDVNTNPSMAFTWTFSNSTNLTYVDISGIHSFGYQLNSTSFLGSSAVFPYLTVISTSKTFIGGVIPPTLTASNFHALTTISAGSSNLTGSIPTTIFSLTTLTYLDLSGNAFTGSIPTQIGQLTSLAYLDLSNSGLSGAIPTQIALMTSLVSLKLQGNSFSGTIPVSLATKSNYPILTLVDLYGASCNYACPATNYSVFTSTDYSAVNTACSSCAGYCLNSGNCSTGPVCACPSPYSGTTCGLSGCSPTNPCNTGNCTVGTTYPAFSCACPSPFSGPTCSNRPCDSAPCKNGGSCTNLTTTTYSCSCVGIFGGVNCTDFGCESSPCLNGGVCTNGTADTDTCSCVGIWTGTTCSQTGCGNNPTACQNGATCNNGTAGTYSCSCASPWFGTNCTQRICDSNPCQNGATCNNLTSTTYSCSCASIWGGQNCTLYGCLPGECNTGICTNTTGDGFLCSCSGVYGGVVCNQTGCTDNPGVCLNGGTCNPLSPYASSPNYNCTCASPWFGQNCTQRQCDSNPCGHGGTCTNVNATAYSCACVNPYGGINCTSLGCDTFGTCQNGGTCVNDAYPAAHCSCVSEVNGTHCELDWRGCDSNPCQLGGSCAPISNGSFVCTCLGGITSSTCLTVNTVYSAVTCVYGSIPQCTVMNKMTIGDCLVGSVGNCAASCIPSPCMNGGACVQYLGSPTQYYCTCPPGYYGLNCAFTTVEMADLLTHSAGVKTGGAQINIFNAWATLCGQLTDSTTVYCSGNNITRITYDRHPASLSESFTLSYVHFVALQRADYQTYDFSSLASEFSSISIGPSTFTTLTMDTISQGGGFQPTFPTELGLMTSLTTLTLTSSHMVGPIPAQVASLSHLSVLSLKNNLIYGTLPASTLSITSTLLLYNNTLTYPVTVYSSVPTNDYPSFPVASYGTCPFFDQVHVQGGACVADCGQNFPCEDGGTCQYDLTTGYPSCGCPPNFNGSVCENNYALCATLTCVNGGTCVVGNWTAVCSCPSNFSGIHCQNDDRGCLDFPCLSGGTCAITGNDTSNCTCPPHYLGVRCEQNMTGCSPSQCVNGGVCMPLPNGTYQCVCPDPLLLGFNCEIDYTHCESSPCLNGSTCTTYSGGFNCSCVFGYTGIHCDQVIDNCGSSPCLNGATCNNFVGSYTCDCDMGYDGTNCELIIDECIGNSACGDHGTCVSGIDSFNCSCDVGYDGMFCDHVIDECASSPCMNGATCSGSIGSFTCGCVLGYTGPTCNITINECASSPCYNGGNCTSLIGAFVCSCYPGTSGPTCNVTQENFQDSIIYVNYLLSTDTLIIAVYTNVSYPFVLTHPNVTMTSHTGLNFTDLVFTYSCPTYSGPCIESTTFKVVGLAQLSCVLERVVDLTWEVGCRNSHDCHLPASKYFDTTPITLQAADLCGRTVVNVTLGGNTTLEANLVTYSNGALTSSSSVFSEGATIYSVIKLFSNLTVFSVDCTDIRLSTVSRSISLVSGNVPSTNWIPSVNYTSQSNGTTFQFSFEPTIGIDPTESTFVYSDAVSNLINFNITTNCSLVFTGSRRRSTSDTSLVLVQMARLIVTDNVTEIFGTCNGGTCLNGGTCDQGPFSYICECAPGFSGPVCQVGPVTSTATVTTASHSTTTTISQSTAPATASASPSTSSILSQTSSSPTQTLTQSQVTATVTTSAPTVAQSTHTTTTALSSTSATTPGLHTTTSVITQTQSQATTTSRPSATTTTTPTGSTPTPTPTTGSLSLEVTYKIFAAVWFVVVLGMLLVVDRLRRIPVIRHQRLRRD